MGEGEQFSVEKERKEKPIGEKAGDILGTEEERGEGETGERKRKFQLP